MGVERTALPGIGLRSVGRLRAATALMPRGEFSIVIAGLAVAADTNPQLGPLAAAYVFILAVAAPILARTAEPLARTARRKRTS